MKWSKLKSLIHERFTDSLRARVSINCTAYGNCGCGHAWITLDGEIVANFCTRAYWNLKQYDSSNNNYINRDATDKGKKRYQKQFVEYGELSRQQVFKSCWDFIHKLSIDEALASENPLIQGLAIIDKRVGKRRLKKIDDKKLQPLSKMLFLERVNN